MFCPHTNDGECHEECIYRVQIQDFGGLTYDACDIRLQVEERAEARARKAFSMETVKEHLSTVLPILLEYIPSAREKMVKYLQQNGYVVFKGK